MTRKLEGLVSITAQYDVENDVAQKVTLVFKNFANARVFSNLLLKNTNGELIGNADFIETYPIKSDTTEYSVELAVLATKNAYGRRADKILEFLKANFDFTDRLFVKFAHPEGQGKLTAVTQISWQHAGQLGCNINHFLEFLLFDLSGKITNLTASDCALKWHSNDYKSLTITCEDTQAIQNIRSCLEAETAKRNNIYIHDIVDAVGSKRPTSFILGSLQDVYSALDELLFAAEAAKGNDHLNCSN